MEVLGKQSHHVRGSVNSSSCCSGLQGLDFTGVEPAKGSPGVGMPADVHAWQGNDMLQ